MRYELRDHEELQAKAEGLGLTREALAWFSGLTTTTVSRVLSGRPANTQTRWALRRSLDKIAAVLTTAADADAFALTQNWTDLDGRPCADRAACLLFIRQQLAAGSGQPPCRLWREWIAARQQAPRISCLPLAA
ncbi:MAG: hypothetical protein ACYCX9_05545 [Candidatus Dormibacteria bacterium]